VLRIRKTSGTGRERRRHEWFLGEGRREGKEILGPRDQRSRPCAVVLLDVRND
jgi:hypothetical protein